MNSIKVLKFLPLLVLSLFFASCEDEDEGFSPDPYVELNFIRTESQTGFKYVDLGLPSGTMWAAANLDSITDHHVRIDSIGTRGLFYAWGELSGNNDTCLIHRGYGDWKGFDWEGSDTTAINHNYILKCSYCKGTGEGKVKGNICRTCLGSKLNLKTDFAWKYYKWASGFSDKIFKYNVKIMNEWSKTVKDHTGKKDSIITIMRNGKKVKMPYIINEFGVVDSISSLEPADDVAFMTLGGPWRMPTRREVKELIDECYWVWTNGYNGTYRRGYMVFRTKSNRDKGHLVPNGGKASPDYSVSDPHIFIRVGGMMRGADMYNAGTDGTIWTKSLNPVAPTYAFALQIDSRSASVGSFLRYTGRNVRPVFNPKGEDNFDPNHVELEMK